MSYVGLDTHCVQGTDFSSSVHPTPNNTTHNFQTNRRMSKPQEYQFLNPMIINKLSSSSRQHPMYALGVVYILLTALQPLLIKAVLTGTEACQNRCFNQSECDRVGNGLCCQWDYHTDQCTSRIGSDICPEIATISLPPGPSRIDCQPSTMSLVESTQRNLTNNQAEPAPSSSSTNYDGDGCINRKLILDRFLCLGFTIAQVKTLIISYKITAGLSIFGSSYIIQHILRDPQKLNGSTYHRIMLGLSCSDIIYSFFGLFLGTWVMPRGEQLFAVGSNATCNIAGFFSSIGYISTFLYSCSLATFYLLKLKYSWVDRKIKDIEKWLLFLPCTGGFIGAISAATMSKLGPYGLVCT